MYTERAPALERELAQLAAEQQRCRQEGKRALQAIGGNEARSDMTTKRLTELDERDHQLEQRMAELRDELAAVQGETVSAAQIQRAVALFDPVWDLLLVPERFRILHLLLESVAYDGATGELELAFYPLGITSLAAEAAMIGQQPRLLPHDAEDLGWRGSEGGRRASGKGHAADPGPHRARHRTRSSCERGPSPRGHMAAMPRIARLLGLYHFDELLNVAHLRSTVEPYDLARHDVAAGGKLG